MSQPCVILAFGGEGTSAAKQTIEVSPTLGIIGFRDEVEKHLGMQQDAFEIRDSCGPIDTELGLQRALDSSCDGVCVLEVRMHPLWERIQELDSELRDLTTRDKATALAIERAEASAATREAEQEARIMEKVRTELVTLQEQQSMTSLVQENFISLVESIAHEQIDLRGKLQSFEDSQATIVQATVVAQAPQVAPDVELQNELHAVRNRMRAAEDGIAALQAEARRLEQRYSQSIGDGLKPSILRASTPSSGTSSTQSRTAVDLDLTTEEDRGGGYSYSMKKSPATRRGAKGLQGGQWVDGSNNTPFAWCTASRQLDRAVSGSRSLPQIA